MLLTARCFLRLGRRDQTCSKGVGLGLNLLLSLSFLLLSELLVHVLINSLRTCIGDLCATRHLLSHHLGEGTVLAISTLAPLEDLLWFLIALSLLLLFLSQFVDVGLGQYACFMRLPLNIVKLSKGFLLQ